MFHRRGVLAALTTALLRLWPGTASSVMSRARVPQVGSPDDRRGQRHVRGSRTQAQ